MGYVLELNYHVMVYEVFENECDKIMMLNVTMFIGEIDGRFCLEAIQESSCISFSFLSVTGL